MFTGLIEEIGTIVATKPSGDGKEIEVRAREVLSGTKIGDSIAIDGACQTVTALSDETFTVFASSVTLALTTLGSMSQGDSVNLERALTPSSRMGGHIVQGHVDGKGRVLSVKDDSSGKEIRIETSGEVMDYVVSKGSIAVDGISLTVVEAWDTSFSLYLIPETVGNTTTEVWKPGQEVNLEGDILAKYVEKMLNSRKGEDRDAILKEKLFENGFLS